jgi:hypothetical protein
MPVATESQLIAQESLRQGWNGLWKATTQDEKVQQGIWGEYLRVHASVHSSSLILGGQT